MSRHVKQDETLNCSKLSHLFCTRKDVAGHNLIVFNELDPNDKDTIDAFDEISGDVSPSLHEVILSKIPSDPTFTMGLPKILTLGIGLPAEMALNIDTEVGLTNGAACIIKKVDFRVPGSSRCSIVWVQFDEESVGRKWRSVQ